MAYIIYQPDAESPACKPLASFPHMQSVDRLQPFTTQRCSSKGKARRHTACRQPLYNELPTYSPTNQPPPALPPQTQSADRLQPFTTQAVQEMAAARAADSGSAAAAAAAAAAGTDGSRVGTANSVLSMLSDGEMSRPGTGSALGSTAASGLGGTGSRDLSPAKRPGGAIKSVLSRAAGGTGGGVGSDPTTVALSGGSGTRGAGATLLAPK